MSASLFVARSLRLLPHAPPAKQAARADPPDAHCWLCGGALLPYAAGWDRSVFPNTFTNVNLAAAPASRTVCQACVAVSSGDTWRAYAERRPELGLVTKHPISWRSYGHLVTEREHTCPKGRQWRAVLLEPPEPPFVAVIPETNQKHLLFRAAIATDRERFPVQVEEDRVWLDRGMFAACLAGFEALYRLGLSKEGIVTGRYHHGSLGKIGPRLFRAAEQDFALWRFRAPDLVRVAVLPEGLRVVDYPTQAGHQRRGFVGVARFDLLGLEREAQAVVWALARLGEWRGVGAHTSYGMGRVRVLGMREAAGRARDVWAEG